MESGAHPGTARLGDTVQITRSVGDLEASRAFYEAIGFRTLARNALPFPWAQMDDGDVLLLLSQDGLQFFGLTYLASDMERRVDLLRASGVPVLVSGENLGGLKQVLVHDPTGMPISLIAYDAARFGSPSGTPSARCGRFGELAYPAADFEAGNFFWECTGFTESARGERPHPHRIFSDGLVSVGLHRTDAIRGRALAYVADNVAHRVDALAAEGLSPARAVIGVDGYAVYLDPDGVGILVYRR